jgi:hypothetical protein
MKYIYFTDYIYLTDSIKLSLSRPFPLAYNLLKQGRYKPIKPTELPALSGIKA